MIHIAGYHKCGTKFFNNLFNILLNSLDFKIIKYPSYLHFTIDNKKNKKKDDIIYCQNYYLLPKSILCNRNKVLFIIREPKQLIISNTKYHIYSTEKWCISVENKFNVSNESISYQEELNKLKSFDDKLFFEMNNYSKMELINIYNDIKCCIKNKILIKIVYIENIKKYADNIEDFIELNDYNFGNLIKNSEIINKNKLKNENFDQVQFDTNFNKIFPNDILEVFKERI